MRTLSRYLLACGGEMTDTARQTLGTRHLGARCFGASLALLLLGAGCGGADNGRPTAEEAALGGSDPCTQDDAYEGRLELIQDFEMGRATSWWVSSSWQRTQFSCRIPAFFSLIMIGSWKSWNVNPFEWW